MNEETAKAAAEILGLNIIHVYGEWRVCNPATWYIQTVEDTAFALIEKVKSEAYVEPSYEEPVYQEELYEACMDDWRLEAAYRY